MSYRNFMYTLGSIIITVFYFDLFLFLGIFWSGLLVCLELFLIFFYWACIFTGGFPEKDSLGTKSGYIEYPTNTIFAGLLKIFSFIKDGV